ncbi:MAG: hypothetical protein TREMPRED_000682 [Tremellales sp. Tagirdzhanova-0007]|nr:MAG: hypothetical protein TREMPRED_000682 [Tremellales sp. Tagirdzhanova-0007]
MPAHFVAVLDSAWGHLRPAIHILLDILHIAPSAAVTLIVDRKGSRRIQQELSAHPKLNAAVQGRWRVVPVIDENGPDILDSDGSKIEHEFKEHFDEWMKKVMRGDGQGAFGSAPNVALIHIRSVPAWMKRVREISVECGIAPDQLKCLVISTSLTTAFLCMLENALEIKQAQDKNANDQDAIDKAVYDIKNPDRILQYPYLPPMRYFEFGLQGVGSNVDHRKANPAMQSFLLAPLEADGLINSGTPEMEPEATRLTSEMAKMPVYCVGHGPKEGDEKETIPLVVNNSKLPTDDGRAIRFLDACQAEYGVRSVAYISFGTSRWLERPEIVDYLVASLLAAEPALPFIFSAASVNAELSKETIQRVEGSGRGLLSSWVPQMTVLSHPATSFYVSHMGCGSMYEGILAGLPLVMVPQFADQPINAAIMSEKRVGVQLYQFGAEMVNRTYANGVKYTGDEKAIRAEMDEVWRMMRGKEGDDMRSRMRELREVVRGSWESGRAREGLQALGRLITQA